MSHSIKVSKRALVKDIRSGTSDAELKRKYGLNEQQLHMLFWEAAGSGIVAFDEVYARLGARGRGVHLLEERQSDRNQLDFPLPIRDFDQRDNWGLVVDISGEGLRTRGLRSAPGETRKLQVPVNLQSSEGSIVLEVGCTWSDRAEPDEAGEAGFAIRDVCRGDLSAMLAEIMSAESCWAMTPVPSGTADLRSEDDELLPQVPERSSYQGLGLGGTGVPREAWIWFFRMLNTMPVPSFVVDSTWTIVFISKMVAEMDRRALDLTGLSFSALFPDKRTEHRTSEVVHRVFQSGLPDATEGTLTCAGRQLTGLIQIFPLLRQRRGLVLLNVVRRSDRLVSGFSVTGPVENACESVVPNFAVRGPFIADLRAAAGSRNGPLRSEESRDRLGHVKIHDGETPQRTCNRFACARSSAYPSEAMSEVLDRCRLLAASEGTILLHGESGSGKDFMARFIHDHSLRSTGPYIGLNCAAVPHDLAESELFGHEAGAFTGATSRKRGLFELADEGTILLNEIGDLPLALQAKLLTFMDTKVFRRVGGQSPIAADTRILAATNKNLQEEVDAGRFRADLFYRLNVLPVRIPSLRERLEDMPVLVHELLERLAKKMRLPSMPTVSEETLHRLKQASWPGNVRQLYNCLERSLALSGGKEVSPSLMFETDCEGGWALNIGFPENRSLNDVTTKVKRSLIIEALRRSGGNRQKAAQLLGITRYALKRQMTNLGLMGENRP